MIIFIEPLGKPFAHLSVVKSLLFAEQTKNESNEILFISSIEYYYSIPEKFRTHLTFKEIKVSKQSFYNIFEIIIIVIAAFKKNWNQKKLKVYLLYSKSYSNIILKLLSLIFPLRNRKLYVLIHGELQNVVLKRPMSLWLDGLCQRILYFFDSSIGSNLKFVIISEFVFKKLIIHLGYKPKNIIALDLPYLYDESTWTNENKNSPLVISTVGVNSNIKKSFMLNDIAHYFEDYIKNGKLKLCTTGRNDDVNFVNIIDVPNLGNSYLLSPEEYSKRIQSSDILIFFNDDNYNLISSGSYFDCIGFKKPILAIRSEQWEYNFKQFGTIGYLCDNIQQICDYIQLIINNREIINRFNENLTEAQNNSSIANRMSYFITKINK